MSDGIVSVYAVFADAEEAGRIGRTIVEERLAACVNLLVLHFFAKIGLAHPTHLKSLHRHPLSLVIAIY